MHCLFCVKIFMRNRNGHDWIVCHLEHDTVGDVVCLELHVRRLQDNVSVLHYHAVSREVHGDVQFPLRKQTEIEGHMVQYIERVHFPTSKGNTKHLLFGVFGNMSNQRDRRFKVFGNFERNDHIQFHRSVEWMPSRKK